MVPKPWRQLAIRMMHALSHLGQAETLKRVADRYYWPEVKKDVADFVKACKCQSVKVHKHTHLPPAHRPIPAKRFTQVMVDVVGPLPRTTTGLTHILTIIEKDVKVCPSGSNERSHGRVLLSSIRGRMGTAFGTV